MKIKIQLSIREAYLLDKLEKKTVGRIRLLFNKIKNIMDKLKATTITNEQYDELWEAIEDTLEDMYNNNPDAYDLSHYELELEHREVQLTDISMGYNHNESAQHIIDKLIERNIIKLKKK